MTDLSPDLWSEDIGLDILSPAIILNTQAAIIQKRTKGVIVAELIQRKFRNVTELYFDLKGQAARHRSRLMVCRFLDDNVYPVWITSEALNEGRYSDEDDSVVESPFVMDPAELRATTVATDQQDFMIAVSAVLRSIIVKSTINSMIAKSNETKQPLEHLIVEESVADNSK